MEDVAKACCDFLTKHLEPSNVIGIARFAEEIGCTELHQRSREYINTHFSEVRCKYREHKHVFLWNTVKLGQMFLMRAQFIIICALLHVKDIWGNMWHTIYLRKVDVFFSEKHTLLPSYPHMVKRRKPPKMSIKSVTLYHAGIRMSTISTWKSSRTTAGNMLMVVPVIPSVVKKSLVVLVQCCTRVVAFQLSMALNLEV